VSAGSRYWDEEQGQREIVESTLDSVYFEPDYDPAVDDDYDAVVMCTNPEKSCPNEATRGDHRKLCLECNPYGDSPVMNNDPSYRLWLNRADDQEEVQP